MPGRATTRPPGGDGASAVKATNASEPASYGPRPKKIAPTYELKVQLCDIAPAIWRRFQVRGDITLYRLHGVIQAVMGWSDSHMYDFVIGATRYGPAEGNFGRDAKDDGRTRLDSVADAPGKSFTYRYDFRDGWEHEITVEKIIPPEEQVRFPICLAGARACPPEECGGPPGYDEFLRTMAVGRPGRGKAGKFDPEMLDLTAINDRLRLLR